MKNEEGGDQRKRIINGGCSHFGIFKFGLTNIQGNQVIDMTFLQPMFYFVIVGFKSCIFIEKVQNYIIILSSHTSFK